MRRPPHAPALLAALALVPALAACDGRDDYEGMYPSIITEMADVTTDSAGRMTGLATDDGTVYRIANQLAGYAPSALYRAVCGFTAEGGEATLYQMQPVRLLRDSTRSARPLRDPTGVACVWRAGKYVNMQLSPMGRGPEHGWGYAVDSARAGRVWLSLRHDQAGIPRAYTETVYASVPLDSLRPGGGPDTVSVTIRTFQGDKRWDLTR